MTAMVKSVVHQQSAEQRQRCVQTAFAVAHLDLQACAIALTTQVLPALITRSTVLARYAPTAFLIRPPSPKTGLFNRPLCAQYASV